MAEELTPSDRLSSSLPDWKKSTELSVTPEHGQPRDSPDINRPKGATHGLRVTRTGRNRPLDGLGRAIRQMGNTLSPRCIASARASSSCTNRGDAEAV